MVAFTVLLRATISLIITQPDVGSIQTCDASGSADDRLCEGDLWRRPLVVDDQTSVDAWDGVAGSLGPYERVGLGVG